MQPATHLQTLIEQIRQTLASAKGKYFIMPSGQTRRLDNFEIDLKTNTTTLYLEREKPKVFSNLVVLEKWSFYSPISADLVPDEKPFTVASEPAKPNVEPVAPIDLASAVSAPAQAPVSSQAEVSVAKPETDPYTRIEQFANELLGLDGLGKILDEQLAKVQRDPKAIAQAKVINDLAKAKIDMARVRVDAVRMMKDLLKANGNPSGES